MGKLTQGIDIETLLKAFSRLSNKKFSGKLVVAGWGGVLSGFQKLTEQFNLTQHAQMIEIKEESLELLNSFDVFILPSYLEEIPFIALKAMALGKVVIATNIYYHPEVIKDGLTGFIVPCGFPERIEAALMRLYANPSLRKEIADAAKKAVEGHFNIEVMANGYLQLYTKITNVGLISS